MNRAFAGNWADRAVELAGAMGLALGLAYAVWLLGDAKLGVAIGTGGFLAGMAILTRIQRPAPALAYFEPASLDPSDHSQRGIKELLEMAGAAITDLANGRVDEEDVLVLDDPLTEVGEESRVVRLFAPGDCSPGELVARIEDYLESKPDPAALAAQPIPDASDALHAALANIRASLR